MIFYGLVHTQASFSTIEIIRRGENKIKHIPCFLAKIILLSNTIQTSESQKGSNPARGHTLWHTSFPILINIIPVQVYEGSQVMEHLSPDRVSGPTLGLLISLYALTSGSAHFAAQASSIRSRQGRIFCKENQIKSLKNKLLLSLHYFVYLQSIHYSSMLKGLPGDR